jgi:hypothetical protein
MAISGPVFLLRIARICALRSIHSRCPRFRCCLVRSDRFIGDGASFNCQYATAYEFGNRRGHGVTNESPASTVQPGGNPISSSHSFQVKFLAT